MALTLNPLSENQAYFKTDRGQSASIVSQGCSLGSVCRRLRKDQGQLCSAQEPGLRSLVSDLQSCSASNLPCTTTLCFVGSDYGQTNWDSDQQRLTREKTSGRHNLISANIKILASGNLNHRAAVFSLVRLEKLCPAPVSLGDGDKGWSQAQLHGHR